MTLLPQNSLNLALRRLGDGDRTASEEVFATLWPALLTFCRKLLRSDADAQDAAQAALEKVFAQSSSFDVSRSALAWALAIATWECRTVLRRRGRRAEVPLDEGPGAIAQGAAQHHALPDDATTEDVLAHAQARRAALELWSELAPLERAALEKAFVDEVQLTTTERKRKQRAVERLRSAWRRLYGS